MTSAHATQRPSDIVPSQEGLVAGTRIFIPALHGLRGLLALWVVVFHTISGHGAIFRIASYGYLAVDMFFMMSGFVLMQSHHAEFRRPRLAGALRFIRLRWWRTYPPWIPCFLVSLVLYFVAHAQMPDLGTALASLFLLEGWAVEGMKIFVPVWSLGVEWVGYLAFPLVAAAVLRAGPGTCLVATAGLLGFLAWFTVNHHPTYGWVPFVRMTCGFISGCLLWRYHVLRPRQGGQRDDLGLVASVLAAAVLCLMLPAYASGPALLLIVHFVVRSGPWTSRILGTGAAQFMGRISFALYLSHYPLPKFMQWLQGADASLPRRLTFTALTFLAATAIAYLLCRCIEEPMRRYGRSRVLAGNLADRRDRVLLPRPR